jgi:hypothetical protein
VCSEDGQVILNGWVYATFGLLDYYRHTKRDDVHTALESSLRSIEADLPRFILPDGWSVYDSLGRVASPSYHTLHVHLMDALRRLADTEAFESAYATCKRASTPWKNGIYTARKVADKFRDKRAYQTQK